MNRISSVFKSLAVKKEKALIGFVTAGDPSLEQSNEVINAMFRAGIDMLELGIPFSDAFADGPVIRRSFQRSLANGTCIRTVLDIAADLRRRSLIPVILCSYYMPLLSYGLDRFKKDARSAGADGVLIVDLPSDASKEIDNLFRGKGPLLIRLIWPSAGPEDIARITEAALGFIYVISMPGVTGGPGLDIKRVEGLCGCLRGKTSLPLCVGFGISTTDQVARLSRIADGLVIGSAFIRLIEQNMDKPELPGLIEKLAREYKDATRA